jgi:methylamine dehydrogenase accessory protein MauD
MERKYRTKNLARFGAVPMTSEWSMLNALWLTSYVLLWLLGGFLGFLLLGTLRAMGFLKWRLEQIEATMPSRLGRSGLKPGKKAPDFTLPSVAGDEVALHDFAGRKVLLVFTQSGCGPCKQIMPELNRLEGRDLQVLVLNKGDAETTHEWADKLRLRFPVLVQHGLDISKKYEAFATPFAFLINEKGVIASKGIISSKQHIGYVLAGAVGANNRDAENRRSEPESCESEESLSHSISTKEVHHV